jgi:DoxX-like protein
MTGNPQNNRTRSIAGTILIFLPGLAVGLSSVLKFAAVPAVAHQMAAMGFTGGRYTLVAALELVSSVLFLFSRTRSFGLLLLSAFLGGAICSHVQMNEVSKGVGPAVLLALAWTGTWLRHPEMLWSLGKASIATGRR